MTQMPCKKVRSAYFSTAPRIHLLWFDSKPLAATPGFTPKQDLELDIKPHIGSKI